MNIDTLPVDVGLYQGPLDILHYLLKQQEFAITEISISSIVHQISAILADSADFALAQRAIGLVKRLLVMKLQFLVQEPGQEDVLDDQELHDALLVWQRELFVQLREQIPFLARQWQAFQRITHFQDIADLELAEERVFDISLARLIDTYGGLFLAPEEVFPLQKSVSRIAASVQRLKQTIMKQMRGKSRLCLQEHLFAHGDREKETSERLLIFFSVLSLEKERRINTLQDTPFADIWLERP